MEGVIEVGCRLDQGSSMQDSLRGVGTERRSCQPAQWQHTLFASTDNQVQLVIDTHANSTGKTIRAFFDEELMKRADGGDHYSVLTHLRQFEKLDRWR
jgi:hypothetical protein